MKPLEDNKKDENAMLSIIEKMIEHVCDHMCQYPKEIPDEEKLQEKCDACEMGDYVCHILNAYDEVNNFEKSQLHALMKKYRKIIRCDECEYQAYEKTTNIYWCRLSAGLDGCLKEEEGCSRGKKREKYDKEERHGE